MNSDEKASFQIRVSSSAVEITVAAHDTTGGMVTKISEAAMIAKLGIDVYIVKVINQTPLSFYLIPSLFCFFVLIIIAHRNTPI